jgi:hypothetical protein
VLLSPHARQRTRQRTRQRSGRSSMSSPLHALSMARVAVATGLALQALGAAAATAPKAPPAAAARSAPLPVTGLCSRVEIAPMVQIRSASRPCCGPPRR